MRKSYAVFTLVAALMTQQAFADTVSPNTDDMAVKPCAMIAKACLNAGFRREAGHGKLFWGDCMKPILLGKTVMGVTISAQDVAACKSFKIDKMKKELQEMQAS